MKTFVLPQAIDVVPRYVAILRSWLTERQMASLQAGGADPDDYCDSNMALYFAVCSTKDGFDIACDSASTEQAKLFTDIWNFAKARNYIV